MRGVENRQWVAKDLLRAVGTGGTSRPLLGAGVVLGVVAGVVLLAAPFLSSELQRSLMSRARAAPSSFNLIASP